MGKIILDKRKGKITIINKLAYPESVNERVYNAISSGAYEGFMPVVIRKKRNETSLECVIQGYITLEEYFGDIVSKQMFLNFVQQILTQIRNCEKNVMIPNSLDLQKDRIFIDPYSKMAKCIYWPVVNNQQANPVEVFLKKLPYEIFFNPNENCDYVEEYKAFFDDMRPFSLNNFEKLILELQGKKTNNGISIPSDLLAEKISKETENTRRYEARKVTIEYDPFADVDFEVNISPKEVAMENAINIQYQEEIYGDVEEGTTVLGYSKAIDVLVPMLIREKTGQKFTVDKKIYRIGKKKTVCDLCITDNSYISRNHADIITRGNRYYIVDRKSTNKTYVDGSVITPEKEIEIYSGTRIRLGNEEFIFEI